MTYHRQILQLFPFFFPSQDSKQFPDIGLPLFAWEPWGPCVHSRAVMAENTVSKRGLGRLCLFTLCLQEGESFPRSLENHWGQGGRQSTPLCQGLGRKGKRYRNRTVTANALCQNLFSQCIRSSSSQTPLISLFHRWGNWGPERLNNLLRVMQSALLRTIPVLEFKNQHGERKG